MQRVEVDGFYYLFSDNWIISKYDEWRYYKGESGFSSLGDGIKAVDIIAIAPDGCVWLIEVKDYLRFRREKEERIKIYDEFELKVIWTLAAMTPASWLAEEGDEKNIANRVRSSSKIRLMLHLETKEHESSDRLHPNDPFNPMNIHTKLLGTKLRKIDGDLVVIDISHLRADWPWRIERIPPDAS